MKATKLQIAQDLKRALHIRKQLNESGHTYKQEYLNELETEMYEITERAKAYLEEYGMGDTHREKNPVQYWLIRGWIAFKMYAWRYIVGFTAFTIGVHVIVFIVKMIVRYFEMIWTLMPL